MVMVHSATVPRGGSFTIGFTGDSAGDTAGSAVTAAFPLSEVGFITSTLSVYQQEGVYPREDVRTCGGAKPPRAKYRYSAAPDRLERRGNRSWPTDRGATGKDSPLSCGPIAKS